MGEAKDSWNAENTELGVAQYAVTQFLDLHQGKWLSVFVLGWMVRKRKGQWKGEREGREQEQEKRNLLDDGYHRKWDLGLTWVLGLGHGCWYYSAASVSLLGCHQVHQCDGDIRVNSHLFSTMSD